MYWGTTTPMPLVLDQWRARTGGKQHFFCLAQQRDRLSFGAPSSRLERSSCALWMQPTAHGEHPYLNAPPSSRPISLLSIQSTCLAKRQPRRTNLSRITAMRLSRRSELPEVRAQSGPTWILRYASTALGQRSCHWRGFRGDRAFCAIPPTL